MKRLGSLSLVLAAVVFAAVAVAAEGGSPRTRVTVIHAVSKVSSAHVVDNPPAGDSQGDVIVFTEDIFDATGNRKVGTDQAYCVTTTARVVTECTGSFSLPGGRIDIEGPMPLDQKVPHT